MQFLEPIGGTTGLLVIIAVLVILSNLANTRSRRHRRRPSSNVIPMQRLGRRKLSNRAPHPKPHREPGPFGANLKRTPSGPIAEKRTPFVPRGVSYRRRTMFTAIELEAFRYLKAAVGDAAHICAKVRVADCLDAHSKHVFSQTVAFRRIALKHVDFVVIQSDGVICFALEVDDSTHQRADRKESDILKDQAFFDAEVPLIRVEPYKLHENAELKRAIASLRPQKSPSSVTPPSAP